MKNIKTHPGLSLVLLFLCLAFPSRANGKHTDTIPEEMLRTLKALKPHNYPYGTEMLMKNFPRKWRNALADTASFPYRISTDVNKLSIFFYQDFASADRFAISFAQTHMPAEAIFSQQYVKKQGLLPVADTAVSLILKMKDAGRITIYSAMVQQDIPCAQCEYQPRQLMNMLFAVSGNKIVSRLLVAYVKGDDLERQERYCYIDSEGNIFIKNFSGDESGGSFLKKEKWRVTPGGLFKKKG